MYFAPGMCSGQIAACGDLGERITGAIAVSNVGACIVGSRWRRPAGNSPHQGENGTGLAAAPLDSGEPLHEGRVVASARCVQAHRTPSPQCASSWRGISSNPSGGTPQGFSLIDAKLPNQDERRGSMRIGSREHQATFGPPRPAVRWWHVSEPAASITARTSSIRSSRVNSATRSRVLAALVEYNHPRESGEPFQQMLVARHLPREARACERVPGIRTMSAEAVAEDAVSDVHVATLRVII